MGKSYDHEGVEHHLVEHARTESEISLFVQKVNGRPKGEHTDRAKEHGVEEVLVVNIRLYDLLKATVVVGLLFNDYVV